MIRGLVALIAITAAGQAPAPDAASTKQKPASVSGTVYSITGEPLRKAGVDLAKSGVRDRRTVTTDESGRFEFTNLEPGRYAIFVQRNGYVPQAYGARTPSMAGSTITLAQGQALSGLSVKLTPHAVLVGKVLDADGDPMTQCAVMAWELRTTRGKKQWMPAMGSGRVNDIGEFRIAGLAPGRYIVEVSPQRMNFGPSQPVQADKVEEGYAVTYYPNAFDISQATPIDVVAGAEIRGLDFRLRKTHVVRVKGRLTDASGKAVTNVPLVLMPANSAAGFFTGGSSTMGRNQDGTFEFTGVVPGSYIMMSRGRMDGQGPRYVYMPVEVGSKGLQDLVAVAVEPLELKGTVRVEGDDKVDVGNLSVSLESLQQTIMGGYNSTRVTKDRTFVLENVTPSKFRVNVMNPPPGTYLKALLYGSQDALATGIDLSSGVAGPIEIVLGANAATTSGTVLDEAQKPASGASVMLLPAEDKRDLTYLFRQTITDQNGSFTLSGIAPGEYTAYAWEDMDRTSYPDADVLKRYEGKGVAVKLKQGETQNIHLKVIPSETAPSN